MTMHQQAEGSGWRWPRNGLVIRQDDWDEHEGLQWYAAHAWASGHDHDPDVEDVSIRMRENRKNYLKWGSLSLDGGSI